MTIEESRLVDSIGRDEHQSKTNYDYEKRVQLEIQALVESELSSRMSSRNKPVSSLLPKPGIYNNTIVIRKEDVLAYSKSHPQNACIPSLRRQTIEMLASGASATSISKTKDTERGELSNTELSLPDKEVRVKVTDINTNEFIEDYKFSSIGEYTSWFEKNKSRIDSIDLCTDDDYDYEVIGLASRNSGNQYPKNSEISKDAELLISENAYYFPEIPESNTHRTSTATFARSSLRPSADSIIGSFADDTELRVIDCHLGKGACWAIAESDDYLEYGRFYINLPDLVLLPGVKESPKNMIEKHSIPDVSSVSIDWTTQPINTPYYDAKSAKHKVVISTGVSNLSNSQTQLTEILSESFKKGAKLILENYGKDSSPDIIDEYKNNEYYDHPVRTTDLFVDDRRGSEIKVLVEFPHRNLVRAAVRRENPTAYFYEDYDVSVFRDYIDQLSKKIGSIGDSLDKFDGKLVTFDPDREGENVSLLPTTIGEIFRKNNVLGDGIFSKKGFLTISWDKDFKIVGMKFEERGGKETRALIGLSASLNKVHMESQRTQSFLYNLNKICATGLDQSWTDFLKNYVSYEEVKVIPNANNPSSTGEMKTSLVKSLEQVQKEESFFLQPERKKKEALKRMEATDFVGSSLLDPRNVELVKNKVSGETKDAYNMFLNNVDFRKIVFKTIKGLVPKSTTSHLDKIRREVDNIESDIGKYDKRIKTGLKDLKDGITPGKLAKFQETNEEVKSGLDKLQKVQRQYQNLEQVLGEIPSEVETIGQEILDQVSESAEDVLIRQISETTGLEPNTVKGLKDKIPDLLGRKITFEEVTHFPKIVFKDDLSTDDISEKFVEGLKSSASAMINEMIKSLVKNTFDAQRLATSSSNRPNRTPDSDLNLPTISLNPELKSDAEEVFRAPVEKIEEILDDATNLLSPEELCELFDGKPSNEATQLMKKVLQTSHPELEMTSASKVSDFFNSIAAYTNFDSCRSLIEAEVPDIFLDDFACPPNESLRKNILKNKGMTDQQIKRQLENERQRSRSLAEDLLDQLKNGPLSSGYEAPDDFCNNSPCQGGKSKDSSSFMDDNFRYSLKSTLNKTFESVYTSFRSEGQEYAKSLFQEVESERDFQEEGEDRGTVKILERKPLANFEKFLKRPEITFSQQFRETIITLPSQKLEFDFGAANVPDELTALSNTLGTKTGSSKIKLIELPSSGGEIAHSIITFGDSYFTTTPIAPERPELRRIRQIAPDSYEFSSKGFLEQLIVNSYEEKRGSISISQKESLANSVIGIHNEVKEKVFRKIYKLMSRSPYLTNLNSNENPDFLLDYINLGPQVTSECDPHLLKVSDEVNDIFNKFKDDLCPDNTQTPPGAKPPKNGLESSMMATCVRLTLRHYLIESLARGLISMSTITGSANISDLILDYSSDKLRISLESYGGSYKEDFYEQVKEIYSGREQVPVKMVKEMMREEYNNISHFLYESLLLGDKTISFKKQFFDSIPRIVTQSEFDENDQDRIKSFTNFSDESITSLPFVIEHTHIDEGTIHSTLNLAVDISASTFRHRMVEVNDNGRKLALIPIVTVPSHDREVLYRNEVTQKLLNICFPIEVYASTAHIHEMESLSKMDTVINAFGGTRDSLYSVFYTVLPQADDWKKANKMLSEVAGSMGLTGSSGLTALWDLNFGVFDTPVSSNTYNFGLPVPWGKSFKGLFFSFAAKAVKDAALKTFKDSAEKSDPNISLASKVSKGMKLAGVNISTTEVSILIGIFPFPNPYMLTPVSMIYNALGLGSFAKSNVLSEQTEESSLIKEKLIEQGLKPPKYCKDMLLD